MTEEEDEGPMVAPTDGSVSKQGSSANNNKDDGNIIQVWVE